MTSVKISPVLDREKYEQTLAADLKASAARSAHNKAEDKAFMDLMDGAGIKIGDMVIIEQVSIFHHVGNAILVGPKRFAQINRDGTASKRRYIVSAPYTVKKITQTPE